MMEDFDNQAVELLPRLRRYARSLSRSMPEAEDLVQDTLEAAMRGKSNWRGVNFKSWMMTIMTTRRLRKTGSIIITTCRRWMAGNG